MCIIFMLIKFSISLEQKLSVRACTTYNPREGSDTNIFLPVL